MGVDFFKLKRERTGVGMPYSAFHRMRIQLAEAIGINLMEMQGFAEDENGRVTGGRSWDEVEDDIVFLLNHSDCDGELSDYECARIYPRLRELANIIEWQDPIDKENALALADAMEECVKEGCSLEFA